MTAPHLCSVAAIFLGAASVSLVAQQPTVTFRSSTGIVLVPVWVKDGETVVQGLTASDFELTDNGVRQEITSIATSSQPADVTIVLDTSGSLDAKSLETLKTGIRRIGQSLMAQDRIRLLTFATKVTEVFGFQPGGVAPPVERVGAGGMTTLYDAFGAALLSAPRNDRPQLVFGVTDGLDNASVLKADDVVSLAGASGASLYATIVRAPADDRAGGVPPGALYVTDRLREAAARTGGLVFENPPDTALPHLFAQVLSDFRSSYLLSFTPRGVRPNGWHELVVKTKERRHTVRARAGYQS